MDPAKFRDIPGWERRPEWLTVDEAGIQEELDRLGEELKAQTARINKTREALESQMVEARIKAEQGRRRLLTKNSEELVAEVEDVLRMLGFDVVNVDALLEGGQAKKDDLRVSDGSWTALVEVKGYFRGGAKTGDLVQISRFQTRYERATGSRPDATWYIVNQNSAQDPDVRPPVLNSDPESLQHFAEDGGVALDTTALFRWAVDVERGRLNRPEAREMLRTASGVFTYPPSP